MTDQRLSGAKHNRRGSGAVRLRELFGVIEMFYFWVMEVAMWPYASVRRTQPCAQKR